MSEAETTSDADIKQEQLCAVYAEAEGHSKPLLQLDLTFARLIDDIVVPYQTDEAFFLDGALLTATKIRRIKILKLKDSYPRARADFNMGLTRSDAQTRKLYGEQYAVRFEHVLRTHSEDVTSQVIKAFNQAIKPSLKNYLPKREELIAAATKIFVEGIRALSS